MGIRIRISRPELWLLAGRAGGAGLMTRWVLHVIGSSNFTTAGIGFGETPNLEANLAYPVSCQHNAKGLRGLVQAWFDSEDVPANFRFLNEPLDDCEDAPTAGEVL